LDVRLTNFQADAIAGAFRESFGPGARLVLFGSRADDSKRGGDIDLCVETDQKPWADLVQARHSFLVALDKALGERKIDVLLRRRGDGSRAIDLEVEEKGVELCRISF
jgi:predicted nucleotidyltransferase